MARYTGPKAKISRKFGEAIEGHSKALQKKNYPPGMHGRGRRKKQSEYAVQLAEKQKAKYIYGILERQFAKMFDTASRKQVLQVKTSFSFLKLVWITPFIDWELLLHVVVQDSLFRTSIFWSTEK